MKKLLLFTLITIITLSSIQTFSQKKEKEKPLVDYRIDNMGYWREMAKKGLVPVQPNIKPPKAIIKSSRINSRGINADSPDVPVSNTGEDTQSETSIFVNPTDNAKVLNSNNSTSWTGTAFGTLFGADYLQTEDFAATWGGSIEGAGGSNSGDPAAVISLTGRQYIGFIHSNSGQGVSYSDDGVTWTSVIAGAPTGGTILDKNHLWIDNSPSSPHEGNLYNAWTDFNNGSEIFFVRSTDDGLSYSTPINISTASGGNLSQGVNIQTGPNGEVYVVWSIYDGILNTNAYGFAKSTDGGATFGPAVRMIENVQGIRNTGVLKNQRVNSFPSMTVDISGGTNNGNIYMVWSNTGVPGTNAGTNKSIYMIKSTDGGSTWATPIRVNQGVFQDGKEAYFSWITSDPESGVLSVIFYDDRDVSSTQVETWVANSYDGGDTWEDFRVSDVAFTPQPIPGLAGGYMGDYLGISARGGMVYPVWPDNRNGYVQAFVSPYETNTRVKPTNLQIALTEATGQTDLTWDFEGASSFLNFIVYRGGVEIGTTTNTFFTDNLPTFGVYNYSVTAMHNDGESSGANGSIQWGNPNIAVNPTSLEETLLIDETSVKTITITNTGELELTYNINSEIITLSNTNSPQAFCTASGGGDEFLSGVEFGSIVNTGTGADSYVDNTAMSTDVDAGSSYPITITVGNAYNVDDLAVWIDWNQDEDFDDAGEEVVCESSIGDTGTYNYNIAVPSDALGGQARMRVRLKWGGSTCGDPCGATTYGEVEDYTVNVNSWLRVETTEGTIAPGASEDINVNFDSTDLALGDYFATISVNSNATDNPLIEIPVTLHVSGDTNLNATATADQTEICEGTTTTLHANPTGGSTTYTFAWTSVPAGFTSTDQNPVVTPTLDTVYTVVVDDGTDNVSSEIAITIINVPSEANEPLGITELCQDSENTTYNTTEVESANFYQWTISPATAGTINGDALTGTVNWDVDFSGMAFIMVTANNDCGAGVTSEPLAVTINESPDVTLTSFDAVCFDASPFALTGGLPTGGTYSGVGVSGENFDAVVAGVGVHTITYAYTNESGCEGFVTQTIEVNPLPTVTLEVFGNVDDNDVAFELTGGLPLGGIYSGVGVTAGQFDPAVAGIGVHTITYTYIDENGCENTAQQTIEVEETLGVNDVVNGINFNLYPNPNNGILNLDINSLNYQNFDVKIINQIGITVVNKKINVSQNSNFNFDLTHLSTGVYYFYLTSEKVNYVEKIIVENK